MLAVALQRLSKALMLVYTRANRFGPLVGYEVVREDVMTSLALPRSHILSTGLRDFGERSSIEELKSTVAGLAESEEGFSGEELSAPSRYAHGIAASEEKVFCGESLIQERWSASCFYHVMLISIIDPRYCSACQKH
jgi:hypothetical protein